MYVEFEAVTYEGEKIISNCIIQKEMPYGLDIRLNTGTKWVRIKNETLQIMQTNINITEANENALNKIKTIMAINDIPNNSKEVVINFSIEKAWELIDSLDEPSLKSLTNLKKQL